jgi:hypothetical protein
MREYRRLFYSGILSFRPRAIVICMMSFIRTTISSIVQGFECFSLPSFFKIPILEAGRLRQNRAYNMNRFRFNQECMSSSHLPPSGYKICPFVNVLFGPTRYKIAAAMSQSSPLRLAGSDSPAPSRYDLLDSSLSPWVISDGKMPGQIVFTRILAADGNCMSITLKHSKVHVPCASEVPSIFER